MKSSSLKLFENRIFAALIITVISLTIVATMSKFYPFNPVLSAGNLGIRNILLSFKKLAPVDPARSSVVTVSIDDATLSDDIGLGRWQDFKREYYAKVIDRLKKDGAMVIGVDVLFSEKSDNSGDDMLAKSIKDAGNVVLGFSKDKKIFPIESLARDSAALGYFDPIINPINSNVYSVAPFARLNDVYYESFSIALLRKYYDISYGKKTVPSDAALKYEE